jgi:hypothetical protein
MEGLARQGEKKEEQMRKSQRSPACTCDKRRDEMQRLQGKKRRTNIIQNYPCLARRSRLTYITFLKGVVLRVEAKAKVPLSLSLSLSLSPVFPLFLAPSLSLPVPFRFPRPDTSTLGQGRDPLPPLSSP